MSFVFFNKKKELNNTENNKKNWLKNAENIKRDELKDVENIKKNGLKKAENNKKNNQKSRIFGNILRVLFCLSCVIFLIFAPNIVFNQNNYKLNLNEFFSSKNSPQCVLSLYHVETFEGGSNSRTSFLNKQASKFNKLYNNCFVVVKTLNLEQFVMNLNQNNLPDLFSFGVGAGKYLGGFLTQLDKNKTIRDDLQDCGKLNNQILAYPYIMSGYSLITYEKFLDSENDNIEKRIVSVNYNKKEIKGLSVGCDENFETLKVFESNQINFDSQNGVIFSSTYDAYLNFINKKSVSLLGTARDVARCLGREEKGAIEPLSYKFLGGYTDLVQGVGVVKSESEQKMYFAKLFAQFLTQSDVQKDLARCGLFGVTDDSIYADGIMREYENALKKPIIAKNIFS